jgi:hypothetical protein
VLRFIEEPATVICLLTHGEEASGHIENRHADPTGVIVVLSGMLIANVPVPSMLAVT